MNVDTIFRLKGEVQHYTWGGYNYIPSLLDINNTIHKPFAEYWMGIHPNAVSQIEINGEWQLLTDFLQKQPAALGKLTLQRFNTLPYLFKVLDVREMLSIQVHPTKDAAEKGFNREEKAGIPIKAANRNYKDKNHKPEMMVALSPFWLLHGFKPTSTLQYTLQQNEVFNPLIPIFNTNNYKALYQYVMEMPQVAVDEMLKPLLQTIIPLYQQQQLTKDDPDFWAAKSVLNNTNPYKNIDRGIFSIYFFNLLQLQPGEAIFQGAGLPHAYLEGINVELMANSDNVLRGGLTPKYIDVQELLMHINFEEIIPHLLIENGHVQEKTYETSIPDFGMCKICLSKEDILKQKSSSFEIGIVIDGSVQIESVEKKVFNRGESFAIAADTIYTLTTQSHCVVYKAFVPV